MKTQMQLNVAIDELLGNIAQYAYAPGTGFATVQVNLDGAPSMIMITFPSKGWLY